MAGSSLSTPVAVNPYVGPRPFETGEHLFGREHEITKLYYVLSAERIVLLHSPSGAGKSSMIQAGLLPRLRERFDVWRPTRVNLPRPAGIPESANRYVLSAALGFEQSIPEELRRSPEELAGMALIDCVRTRKRRPSAPANVLLIFDQFEEILTTDPLAMEARQEFFDQLGEVLRDPTHWALFAMREDFLAPLDPYVERVPTHMQNRFRIDLLGLDEAREAIAQPSQEGGRVFEDAAVGKLVNDLATMKVQQPDGSFQDQVGLHVEPLQLQVVCRGLWERLSPEKRSIAVDDVTELGDVTEALSSYYSMEVSKIADGEEAMEREIREWVGDKLITPDGTRGPVLRGAGKSEGLANTLVAKLVDTHLVRAEHRAGAIWYELAHDRLVDPIRSDNTQWREAHLNQVQKRASLWAAQGQPDGLLLLGTDLAEAHGWAKAQRALTDNEKRFLDASAVAQEVVDKQRKQQRLIHWACVGLAIIAVVCLLALSYGWVQKQKANLAFIALRRSSLALASNISNLEWTEKRLRDNNTKLATAVHEAKVAEDEAYDAQDITEKEKIHAKEESQVALAGKLIAQAKDTLTDRPDLLQLSTLLALESMNRDRSVETDHFLRQSLAWLRTPIGHPITHATKVAPIAFSPDGKLLATGSTDGTVKISDALTGQLRLPVVHTGPVESIAFNGDYLATASTNGTARIWNSRTGASVGEPYALGRWMDGTFSVGFSPTGHYIAAIAADTLTVWEVGDNHSPRLQSVVGSPASVPLFTRDGKQLIVAGAGNVRIWQVDGWKESKTISLPAASKATPPILGPDGLFIANISGKSVGIWSGVLDGAPKQIAQLSFKKAVTSVAFSPQEKGYFVTAGEDRTASLWRLPEKGEDDASAREVVRLTHPDGVSSIAFSPDGKFLASGAGNTVRLWKMAEDEGVTTLDFGIDGLSGIPMAISSGGQYVAIGHPDKIQVFLSDASASNRVPETELTLTGQNAGGTIVYFDISSDGKFVAASIRLDKQVGTNDRGRRQVQTSYVRQVWNRVTRTAILRTEGEESTSVFMFSPNGRYLATGGPGDIVADLDVRELNNGRKIQLPSIKRDLQKEVNYQFFFTDNGKYLAVAGKDSIHLLDTTTWTERAPIKAGAPIEKFVVSADEQHVALTTASDKESTLQAWRIGDSKPSFSLSQKRDVERNTSLAISPEGDYLTSADWSYDTFSDERRVRIWDVATKQVVGSMPVEGRVNWFSLGANGSLLGVATDAGLKVWDQAHKEEVASTETAARNLLTSFSPRGKYLLTITSNNVTSWFWDPSRVAGAVCAKLTTNLTVEQWEHYLTGEPYRKTCPSLAALVSAPSDQKTTAKSTKRIGYR